MSNTVPILDDSVLLDTVQVAQLLKMSTFFVVRHSAGKVSPTLRYMKVGNRLRFRPSDVQDFITSRAKK